jgi:hypothetical protein
VSDPYLDEWLAFSRLYAARRLQQFGQEDCGSTWLGKTGCTHTVLQRLIYAQTGRLYTHDEISQIATYPWPSNNLRMRGMYSGGSDDEVGRVVARFGLPYRLTTRLTFRTVREYTKRGPVMLAVRYGYWPERKGYNYMGRTADGRPNGFALRYGKTQLSGAEGIFHMVLFLGVGTRRADGIYPAYANEPNHGSASRPERPDYDIVSLGQLKEAYDSVRLGYGGTSGRITLAWVPTRINRPRSSLL